MSRALLTRIAPFWVLALVVGSLQPWRPGIQHGSALHAVLHFLAYFATAIVLLLAARSAGERNRAPFVVVGLGLVIEQAQHILYGSPLEWRDLASDVSAALLACLLLVFRPLRCLNTENPEPTVSTEKTAELQTQ